MKNVTLTNKDKKAFQKALDHTKDWCREHQWELGAAEMALGASAIAWAVHNGVIEMGHDIVASTFTENHLDLGLGVASGSLGALAGNALGSIGIVGAGGGIGIPALFVTLGGSIILGTAGYTIGNMATEFLKPAADFTAFFGSASVLAVGLGLVIDGAKRVVKDERLTDMKCNFKNRVIYLHDVSVEVVAQSADDLKSFAKELKKAPKNKVDWSGSVTASAVAGVGGSAAGSSLAASSVTLFGSQALGSLGLSMGVVSAPIWPVIAFGTTGCALGYGAWKCVQYYRYS